ncbi:MAG: hypothetical protein L0G94_15660 [Brachybacterium sp.]|uniref:hypothetical protein n=1 Tax=Brachybacterium sp. TaxID=1891286 RepID=UPI0026473033|nr:hypothetical protein [Brachybacterium sp.]MDN5688094.1 hypothetical protein [Brachybacterium sp.]
MREAKRYSAGDWSLTCGLAAVGCLLIPAIGDIISAPVAVAAVVLGLIGIGHHDTGLAPKMLPAAVGTTLGALALFFVVVMFIAGGPVG